MSQETVSANGWSNPFWGLPQDNWPGDTSPWQWIETHPVDVPIALFTKLHADAIAPTQATAGSSGWDLSACLGDLPGGSVQVLGPRPVAVPTGIAVAVPPGYDLQLRGRSGLAAKGVMAHLGTIDSDYRGELRMLLYTVGGVEHIVRHGDRIGQLVLSTLASCRWREAPALNETLRGAGGFGSSGR